MENIGKWIQKNRGNQETDQKQEISKNSPEKTDKGENTGTFVEKLTAEWIWNELPDMNIEILVWRTVNVRFLRAVFHRAIGGNFLLKILYVLEEKYPTYFGKNGQYPLIVIHK